MAGYWPIFFGIFMDRDVVEADKNATKNKASHLDRTNLLNEGFMIWLKRKIFRVEAMWEILIG